MKRKRRRRKRTVPKVDESVSEDTPQPLGESGVPLGTDDLGHEKADIEITAAVGDEKVPNSKVKSDSSYTLPAVKVEEAGSKEMETSAPVTEQAKVNSPGNAAQSIHTNKPDVELPHVTEKAVVNDKEKQTKTSAEDVPTGSTTPPTCSRQEAPHGGPTEVKKSPLIPRYSRFEFLANSMIITDVTTERGTVTVKECSAYEGFYGPEPDKSS